MSETFNRPNLGRLVRAVVPMAWLASSLAVPQLALATVAGATPSHGGATILGGMWCSQDAKSGETIVDYSASGLEVTAFTVLSEADPRRIGRQSSMQLKIEASNVFSRSDATGAEEVFSVDGDGLTVDSFLVQNRGTRAEQRQVLATQSYRRCDVRQALQRAQAFLSSPRAEAATRKAVQFEAQQRADIEQWQHENAAVEQRRNASRDAFYADLIQHTGQVVGRNRAGNQR